MVVMACDARITQIAMFAPSWLQKLARSTCASWMENSPVIGVLPHVPSVVLRGDTGLSINTQIEKEIRLNDDYRHKEAMY